MSEPKIIQAVKPTRPTYSLREAEDLMTILLQSGHPQADHLVSKLITAAEQPGPYLGLLERIRTSVLLGSEEPAEPDRSNCDRCHGGELYDLMGHTYMGHRVTNSLAHRQVMTFQQLTAHSTAWLLDEGGLGAKGFHLVREKVGGRAWSVMEALTED